MRVSRSTRQLLTLGLGVVLALVWWLSQHGGDTTDPGSRAPSDGSTYAGSPEGGDRDPESGLLYVAEADLPPEAAETLDLIDAGGPFPYNRDGVVFENRERILPVEERGYYHEYTVPTPGTSDRGARRFVTGSGGEVYYTDDHYQSFRAVRR